MKKRLLFISVGMLISFLISFIPVSAQNIHVKKSLSTESATRSHQTGAESSHQFYKDDSSPKAACDTLNWYQYQHVWTIEEYSLTATPQYSSGFVNGVNVDGDKAKANYFANTGGNTYVMGAMIAFSRAYSTTPSKIVTVKVWDVVGGNPGNVLASKTITMQKLMSDVSGNYFTNVHFDNPVNVGGAAFFVGVDFSTLDWATSHDTLSIQSNLGGETTPSAVWEYQSSNAWYQYTTAGSWNLAISLAILPFMANTPADAQFTQSTVSTCAGYPVVLNASSSVQNSVHWVLTGATPSTSNVVSPTVTYANAGTFPIKLYVWGGSCNNIDSLITSITIVASPIPSATATPPAICIGNSSTLNALNGVSYQWNGYPPSPTATQVVSPTSTTIYTVTVTGSNGCSASQGVTVTVHTLPNANATANPLFICVGSSTLISATPGMTSYIWNPGGSTNAAFSASPSTTTIYSVTVVDGNGCTGTDTAKVIVDPCTGISEANNNQGFSITPNPSNGIIHLLYTNQIGSNDFINIYNLEGQLIFKEAILQNSVMIDLSALPKGIYYFRLLSKDQTSVRKLILQ
jgi:serine protease